MINGVILFSVNDMLINSNIPHYSLFDEREDIVNVIIPQILKAAKINHE